MVAFIDDDRYCSLSKSNVVDERRR